MHCRGPGRWAWAWAAAALAAARPAMAPADPPPGAVTAPAAPDFAAADEQRRLADGLYARGMDDLAIAEYQRLIQDHPAYPGLDAAFFRLAESFRRSGRAQNADFFYRRLAADYPRSPWRARADLRRGELLEETGDRAGAAAAYESVLVSDPAKDAAAAVGYRLGRLRLALGDAAAAERAWRAAADAAPDAPFAGLAAVELAELLDAGPPERRAEAIALLERAAAGPVAETAAEALFRLFRRRYLAGEPAAAAAHFEELRRRFPDAPRTAEARRPAAWAWLRAGRPAEALALARASLDAAAPPEAEDEWLYLRANAERLLLDAAAASDSYRRLFERHAASRYAGPAAYEWALLAHQRREFAEAVRRAGLAPPPEEHADDLNWLLADAHAELGHVPEAIQFFRLVADRRPPGPRAADALYRLGRVLQDRGEWAAAAASFRRLAEAHPDHAAAAPARAASAHAFARLDQWPEAWKDWAALADRYPDHPLAEDALFQKAGAEVRLGRDAAARESLAALLRRFPGTRFGAEARYRLADLLDGAGEPEAAERELRAAAALEPAPEWARRIAHRRAAVLQKLGRTDEAAGLLTGLLDTPSRAELSPELLEWLARRALAAGDAAAAARAAEPLTQSADEAWRPAGWYLLGRAREAAGRGAEAIAAYARAAEAKALTRDRADAQFRRAALEAAAGDLASARRGFEALAEQTAGADTLLDLRARALHGLAGVAEREERWDEAARLFTAVAVLFDDPALTPDSLRRAAAGFRRLGAEDRAAQLLRELAERYPDHR